MTLRNTSARGEKIEFLAYVNRPRGSHGVFKNVSQFGPAVWPAKANVYSNIYIYLYGACLYRKLAKVPGVAREKKLI